MIPIEKLEVILNTMTGVIVDATIQADWRGPEHLGIENLCDVDSDTVVLECYEQGWHDGCEADWEFRLDQLLAGTITDDGRKLLASDENIPHMIALEFTRSYVLNLRDL
jgi:hypothetical protein